MSIKKLQKRTFEIIQLGSREDMPSLVADYVIVITIFANLAVLIIGTFEWAVDYKPILKFVEYATLVCFILEYVLRIWTASYLFPDKPPAVATIKFLCSFDGLVELLTILPYIPASVLPTGFVAFRALRAFRVFHLFRIQAQYDAFNVVVDVLREKKQQLFSSVALIAIMMLASSIAMYDIEHKAQPDVFVNAFSGAWWSMSTLLTVGYGDIYPVTTLGRLLAMFIAFLGVGLVAIPTGIISAGFVEQYTKASGIVSNDQEYDGKKEDKK